MRMMILAAMAVAISGAAKAELVKVDDQQKFVTAVAGKTLTRPWVKINLTPDGRIEGRGLRWDVEGTWSWKDGYFCRDLFWGGDPLGYNCQEVQVHGERILFTSDRGAGDSAEFRLR
ncbi:dihydrodipicolinate reductase [Tateyamaria pelophila]|uniref:dihydrodipicolinate reductase n=1 Tax=Tateyamaria pelophila TaxID=328415 RepID=UPI001CBD03C5|nr:dihydrodipicolinate reductase [Tateyamaria pelophila]